jgi:hypothetical protein
MGYSAPDSGKLRRYASGRERGYGMYQGFAKVAEAKASGLATGRVSETGLCYLPNAYRVIERSREAIAGLCSKSICRRESQT